MPLFVALRASVILMLLLIHVPAAGQPTALRTVVSAGQAAPGGGTFEHFSVESQPVVAPPNARGDVAFFASLLRGVGSEGLFLATARGIVKVAVAGEPAPGISSGTFANLDFPALNDRGDVAFLATVRRGRETVEAIHVRT